MEITWLGHGTFQFRLPSGETIVMDPWTEGNPAYPQGYKIERTVGVAHTPGHRLEEAVAKIVAGVEFESLFVAIVMILVVGVQRRAVGGEIRQIRARDSRDRNTSQGDGL